MPFSRNTRVRFLDVVLNWVVFSLLLGIVCSFVLAQEQNPPLATAPADDTKATRFVSDLLSKMTIEEKLGQMSQIAYKEPHSVPHDERVLKEQTGSFLFLTDPVEINRLQHIAVEQTRLHIPLIFGYDVIHGFRTIYPIPLALAARGIPASRYTRKAWRPEKPVRWAFDGPLRRWWTSQEIRDGGASWKAQGKTPIWVRAWLRPRCAASREM